MLHIRYALRLLEGTRRSRRNSKATAKGRAGESLKMLTGGPRRASAPVTLRVQTMLAKESTGRNKLGPAPTGL